MAITKGVQLVHDSAYAGMVADLQLANRVSKLNATTETIPAGTAVQADTVKDSVKPVATGGSVVGVVVRELVDVTKEGGVIGINANKTGTVLTDGVIWVKAGIAVAVGDKVFAGVGATVKGFFTNGAGASGTESVEIPNAKFLDSATNKGDLVRIKLTIGG